MPRKQPVIDSDSLPVMVPRNNKPLAPVAPARVRRLREHLISILKDLCKANHLERFASPLRPAPTGFPALVARSACSLCKGWCCRNGDDDAFLDDRTLARVRLAKPDATENALLRLYLSRVPDAAYRDSCIFHGKHGCTLDRPMRADVCNTYYCGGLSAFIKSKDAFGPNVVLAGEGEKMRVSATRSPRADRWRDPSHTADPVTGCGCVWSALRIEIAKETEGHPKWPSPADAFAAPSPSPAANLRS